MTPRRAAIFLGHSDFGSVNAMAMALADALEAQGCLVERLDLCRPETIHAWIAADGHRQADLLLSLNGIGLPGDGPSFHDESKAKVIGLFVDHPIYHRETILRPLADLRLAFPTAHHLGFCRRFIRADRPLAHIPHGALPPPPGFARPWGERDIAILLPASLGAPPEDLRRAWDGLGPEVKSALSDIVCAHDRTPTHPLEELVLARVPEAEERFTLLRSYFITADSYLRARAKAELARALARRGLTVTAAGPGWEGEPVTRLGAQPIKAVLALMGRARLVLNPLPPYYASHERPLQAAALGAAAPTLPYPPDEAAEALLGHDAEGDARQATARVLAEDLWEHRLKTILGRMAGLSHPPGHRAIPWGGK